MQGRRQLGQPTPLVTPLPLAGRFDMGEAHLGKCPIRSFLGEVLYFLI